MMWIKIGGRTICQLTAMGIEMCEPHHWMKEYSVGRLMRDLVHTEHNLRLEIVFVAIFHH